MQEKTGRKEQRNEFPVLSQRVGENGRNYLTMGEKMDVTFNYETEETEDTEWGREGETSV